VVRLQAEPIDLVALGAEVHSDADGALASFAGIVRDHNRGRRVLRLEYTAYEPMALAEMRRIEDLAFARFAVTRVAIVHRTGVLGVGEVSVAVLVAAPHRGPAFDACRFVIDTLKHTVPIWKKEFFEGGEAWIEGPEDAQP
jgi:molybdopterin synthase catalytic subunit